VTEDDDTPIYMPPEPTEENWWEVDANGNGIPDAWEPYYNPTPDEVPEIYEPSPTTPQTVPTTTTTTSTSTGDPYYPYGGSSSSADASAEAKAIAHAGGGEATGGEATITQEDLINFNPVFNFGNPAQRAVDVTMDAYDQYQKALLDKYYADTLLQLGMAALGPAGGAAGRALVGPVGLFNRVTQGGGRYNQPVPFVKKPRPTSPRPDPKNPTPAPGPVPPPVPTFLADAAEGEAPDVTDGGFDAAQFVSEVQADAGVPTDALAASGVLPPTPPRDEEDEWKDRDTKEFLEEEQGSGPIVHPGLQPRKLTLPSPRALASLQQRPPEVEKPGPIYRHMASADGPPFPRPRPPIPPRPPWGQPQQKAADPLGDQMADIMGGAGVPMGGAMANQINTQGQANEFQNLATAAQRGQDYAQAAYGLKGQERGLSQAQQQFRQQKAQDVMANLASKMGQRGGPRTRVRVT